MRPSQKAGIDWRKALDDALDKTTHFVALLSDGYELSQTCVYEIERILGRGQDVTILPFMAGGRAAPHPKLANLHNTLLPGTDAEADADVVVKQVMEHLERGLQSA